MIQLQSPPPKIEPPPQPPHPQLQPPQLPPPIPVFPLPQNRRMIKMIQIELLLSHPHPQLHPPPQFVADKSLMINPPKEIYFYNVYYVLWLALFPQTMKNFTDFLLTY